MENSIGARITDKAEELDRWQEWLQAQRRDDDEIQAVITGFKRALGRDALVKIPFLGFAKQYQWLVKTLKVSLIYAAFGSRVDAHNIMHYSDNLPGM